MLPVVTQSEETVRDSDDKCHNTGGIKGGWKVNNCKKNIISIGITWNIGLAYIMCSFL